MTDSCSVRSGTPEDWQAIRDVACAAWHAAYDPILGSDHVASVLDRWYAPDRLRPALEDDAQPFFVAVDAGRVVGFAHAVPAENETFELTRLYVHPDRWRDGVGTRLLDRVADAIAERGGGFLWLVVFADNDDAVDFYEASGFDRLGDAHDDELDVHTYTYGRPIPAASG